MSAVLSAEDVHMLGRTDGGPEQLDVLTAGQHTRRLLLLRMLFDAVDSVDAAGVADAARTTDAATTRLARAARDHADLLEAAERVAPPAARRVLFYPLTGPWAEACVRRLADAGAPRETARDLAHLGSLAAAAALRAGMAFTSEASLRDGRLTLPTLGALHSDAPDDAPATLSGGDGRLTLRTAGERPVEVRRDDDGTWRSPDPRWLPLRTLSGGPRPVLLDDLDPGRLAATPGAATHQAPGGDRDHRAEQWAGLWDQALPLLRLGGAARSAELALLDCIVPLTSPPGLPNAPRGPARAGQVPGRGSEKRLASGTSPRAFGAVLASPPPSPALLAAALTHELQHAKLAALSELTPLHTAGDECRHWAPWRPDPRPFDGLLHGAYSHLALAALWQRLALALPDPAARDHAWAAHARCWTQVGAVLPVLRGSRRLTDAGRRFAAAMTERHEELRELPPPTGHLVRATAYVETARTLWLRQHAPWAVT
ncbi:aKG-HExxH-type peptide beta-hydroxylase [Streptomyces sp. 4N509B]|uniref:aKG-HExxH-type peptide beta-hydroxylase n=1 Tax=Streptomyces sp. 4N509B TaxID=3457413 RepID=UPI003FD64301